MKGPDAANKLPGVTPHTKCRLRLLKMERIKDYLLMEEEFIRYTSNINLRRLDKIILIFMQESGTPETPRGEERRGTQQG